MPESRVFIRPRYGEVDSMGVVYHANYLAYFDIGRTEYMRDRGLPYVEVEKRGFLLSVVDVGVKYRKSARYDEQLELITTVGALSRTTVRFEYRLLNPAGELLTTGFTRLACLGKNNKPAMLPEDLRQLLESTAEVASGRESGLAPSETP